MNTKTRLLIVDDSPEDCVGFQRQLERAATGDYSFQTAHTSAQGLAECRVCIPDCILLDFNLPDGDGLEFLGQLRQEHGDLAPPVIMLTGKGNEDVAVQAMKLGAQDCLVKDSIAGRLRVAIQNSIDCIGLRRQVVAQQQELIRLNQTQASLLEELQLRAIELSDADRRKNEFLAVLAHELRNPLGPIRNAAQIMQLVSSDSNSDAELARNIIDRQIGHMSRLIDDLLDVSRIVRGKMRLQPENLELQKLVRSTVEDHRAETESGGLTLTVDIPDSEVWVYGDQTRLSQVVGNLLDNARKFTPFGGAIIVSMRISASESIVEICVADTGEGLEPSMQEHMFEIFNQADRSLDRSRGGLGLGLAIVKGIAELHRGKVEATSQGLGCGCQIIFSIPMISSGHRPPTTTESNLKPNRTLRILIVEDNRDAAHSLKILLEKLGHTLAVAYSGHAALQLAKTFSPELVLCDIGLSEEMTGYVVAEKFRDDPAFASTYLVALTGYGGEEDQKRAIASGFDLHLTKPMSMETLHNLSSRVKNKPQALR